MELDLRMLSGSISSAGPSLRWGTTECQIPSYGAPKRIDPILNITKPRILRECFVSWGGIRIVVSMCFPKHFVWLLFYLLKDPKKYMLLVCMGGREDFPSPWATKLARCSRFWEWYPNLPQLHRQRCDSTIWFSSAVKWGNNQLHLVSIHSMRMEGRFIPIIPAFFVPCQLGLNKKWPSNGRLTAKNHRNL